MLINIDHKKEKPKIKMSVGRFPNLRTMVLYVVLSVVFLLCIFFLRENPHSIQEIPEVSDPLLSPAKNLENMLRSTVWQQKTFLIYSSLSYLMRKADIPPNLHLAYTFCCLYYSICMFILNNRY